MTRHLFPCVFLTSLLATPMLSAQQPSDYVVPRTFLGQPDLEGTWHTKFVTTLERLDGVEDLVVTEAQAAEIAQQILGLIPHNEDPDFAWQGINSLAIANGSCAVLSSSIQPTASCLTWNLPWHKSTITQLAMRLNSITLNSAVWVIDALPPSPVRPSMRSR
ncbi:MAG: hypothetical protein CMQ15_10775 [Gammaproteobacteria bacterium]|jgi:hypothetical protein|nr:hypothetical protein [Gammaproteobacteria bacterium]HJN95500.1 hypothetical protein [Gammaproteobacteria bacterium]|tara:strand:+ start:2996 stop:3481 length:486 start_codon:yes stop_codon:yes gene_type:complete